MSARAEWPDVSRYAAGNAGVPFVWTFEAGADGPHAVINALTHGNEPCGAVALTRMLAAGIRPRRGRLTLSFANVEAYSAFRAGGGQAARFLDRDMNRLWHDAVIDGDTTSREAARARELRPAFSGADYLLDLHSTASVARPFFVIAKMEKTRRLADQMGWPPTQQLMPGGCLDGRHVIDYGRFSDPADPATALTVECGRHEDEASGDVAFSAAMLFLKRLDMLAPADCAADPPQEPIERYRTTTPYLVKSNRFRLLAPESGFVSVAAGEAVALDGDEHVRAPFDATIIAPRPSPAAGETAFIWAIRVP